MRCERYTIELPDDYQGEQRATLLEYRAQGRRGAVLYIHGYIDYFFQEHMAERFVQQGYDFYGLELRKYGRSLLPNQSQFYCRSLTEYFAEIDAALRMIDQEHISLMGHSTGGLIASLYMAQGNERHRVEAMILNSPFFDFNTSWFKHNIAIPIAGWISKIYPYAYKSGELSPFVATSIHNSMRGEWSYDLAMKPQDGVPLYFAWLGAVRQGQKMMRRGLGITTPILVMRSARSSWHKSWHEDFMRTDSVLNVEDIARYAPRLGSNVTQVVIEDGMHDLTLSAPKVREQVLDRMLEFLEQNSR